MLLLTVGTFAGAYPLMYFAQEYVSLEAAVLMSAGVVLSIIGVRAATLMGPRLAVAGVVLPAAVIMAVTLVSAVWTRLQGILLTAEALAFFVAMMLLLPKAWKTWPLAPDREWMRTPAGERSVQEGHMAEQGGGSTSVDSGQTPEGRDGLNGNDSAG